MSDFFDNLVDLLPEHSALKKPDNQLRRVLDYTVGEWFDNRMDVNDFKGNLFLQTATGKWLDLFGLDYGIPRMEDESDEDYRQRIIYEKLDNLTADTLINEYGLKLYCFVSGFNANENSLTSNNPYLSNRYMSVADKSLQDILNNKFIMDTSLLFLNEDYVADYILNQTGDDLIFNYISIYSKTELNNVFRGNTEIKNVKLDLLDLVNAGNLFGGCSGLNDVELYLPHVSNAERMFAGCNHLINVKLEMRAMRYFNNILYGCVSLKTINVHIPYPKVSSFKSYVLGLRLPSLESFIINGVEQL